MRIFVFMWQKMGAKIPANVKGLFLRIGVVLSILTCTRLLFFFYNYDSFSEVVWTDWLSGIWFDLVTISLLLMPFISFSLLPIKWQNNKWIRFVQALSFHLPLLAIIALNLLDTEYYNYTQKRSTADLFAIVSAGNDIGQLLSSFLRDFWFLLVFFVILFIANRWLYRKTNYSRWKSNSYSSSTKREIIYFFVLIPIFVLLGRGGTSHKPISPIDATLYTNPQNTALVLNSAFTFLKSYGKNDLEAKKYFSDAQLEKLYNPIQTTHPQNILPNKTNVMIIMLESFGNEWVGTFNNGETYTPFLDSLIKESWSFKYGISNGKKSIEAVPTIIASLPTWMDNPYISSAYGSNPISSLPNILKEEGYSTAFYHGATNGSMRFNSFTQFIGFDKYVGRFEYNNDAHFDKTWGILDEYFNPWTAKQLTKMKAPFMATLFTLSSHHPYYVPKYWQSKLKKGPQPICQSLHYGDISLQKFFEQAKKEPWYDNTLFVLVADHTPSTNSDFYSNRTQMYKIPIAFYHPSGKLPKRMENEIFQQLDIMPTVLDLVNVKTKYYAFGHSYFSKEQREALCYLEGTYYYFNQNYLLYFSNDKKTKLVDHTGKQLIPKDELKQQMKKAKAMEVRTKAIIQRYNRDLIQNKTRVE